MSTKDCHICDQDRSILEAVVVVLDTVVEVTVAVDVAVAVVMLPLAVAVSTNPVNCAPSIGRRKLLTQNSQSTCRNCTLTITEISYSILF